MFKKLIRKLLNEEIKDAVRDYGTTRRIEQQILETVLQESDLEDLQQLKQKLMKSTILDCRRLVDEYIKSEEFIDALVQKINKKQLT